MQKSIIIKKHGGPEVLELEKIKLNSPGPNEIRVKNLAIGLNYIDTYHRSGLYPVKLPSGIGLEGSGVVKEVGSNVKIFKIGDNVAYASPPLGSYSEERNIPENIAVKLPKGISHKIAASIMTKGLTAFYLLNKTYKANTRDTVLFHAVAGGVGMIACQWLKQKGVSVIGTVGSDEKAEIAKTYGCDHPIVYTRENFSERVMEITDGEGVPVVYDGVGASVHDGSLACLARFGTYVNFGAASGQIPPVPGSSLAARSLYFTRPGLAPHTATPDLTQEIANHLFNAVRKGVKIEINHQYELRNAAEAHRALEARATTGSTVFSV